MTNCSDNDIIIANDVSSLPRKLPYRVMGMHRNRCAVMLRLTGRDGEHQVVGMIASKTPEAETIMVVSE